MDRYQSQKKEIELKRI